MLKLLRSFFVRKPQPMQWLSSNAEAVFGNTTKQSNEHYVPALLRRQAY